MIESSELPPAPAVDVEAGRSVEALGAHWRKSSKSLFDNECIEACSAAGRVLVRDSKNSDGPVLDFTEWDWTAFIAAVGKLSARGRDQ